MFGDGALTFQEHVMKEPHPLAIVHRVSRPHSCPNPDV
jgi:hypothetical protein